MNDARDGIAGRRAGVVARTALGVLTAMIIGVAPAALPAPLSAQQPIGPGFDMPGITPDSQQRPRAISHSDFYYTRLKVHRIGSYVMLPLFAGEYVLGNKLLNESDPAQWVRSAHGTVAGGLGVLFGVNTATGLWNLWESRHDGGGARKYVHSALLIASDAGFLWAGQTAENAQESLHGARRHRDIALGSMSVAALGTAMMWLWR